jgi:hypothetical protein
MKSGDRSFLKAGNTQYCIRNVNVYNSVIELQSSAALVKPSIRFRFRARIRIPRILALLRILIHTPFTLIQRLATGCYLILFYLYNPRPLPCSENLLHQQIRREKMPNMVRG